MRHAEYVFLGVIGWEDNQGQEELGVFCILIWTEATCMFVRDLWALDVYNLLKFAKKKIIINIYIFKHLENFLINEKDGFK